ncbi:MAG TPA: hypothetical protein VIZ68_05950 [Thermoplasmata archaeon]
MVSCLNRPIPLAPRRRFAGKTGLYLNHKYGHSIVSPEEDPLVVYVEDIGTTLDIPFDQLEAFLDSAEHSDAHPDDTRNFNVVEHAGETIVLTFERKLDGQWGKSSSRVRSFPPYCRCVEEFEGVFAVSRFVSIHRPEGTRTRVEIFGDIQCKGRNPEEVRTLWLGILAKSHDEDLAALRKYRSRR